MPITNIKFERSEPGSDRLYDDHLPLEEGHNAHDELRNYSIDALIKLPMVSWCNE